VNGGHDGAYLLRVDPGVGGMQIDPFVHPDLPAFADGEYASPGGARLTCGAGTPAAQAASWNAVAERTSPSPDG